MKDSIHELLASMKVAIVAILGTLGTWTAAIIEWIPADIAKIGIIPAAALSSMLCYVHYKRLRMDTRKRAEESKKNAEESKQRELKYKMDMLDFEMARERRKAQVEQASNRREND